MSNSALYMGFESLWKCAATFKISNLDSENTCCILVSSGFPLSE